MDIESYIAQLNSDRERTSRSYDPVEFPSKMEQLSGIKAVFFDVYGTLIDSYREEFQTEETKQAHVLNSFRKVIDEFSLENVLFDVDPSNSAPKTLRDLYHGLIFFSHEKSVKEGQEYPEVKIEGIWSTLIQIFVRHGYEVPQPGWDSQEEMAFAMAYLYHFSVLGRKLYPGVYEVLSWLKKKNMVLGIISNAQFYTRHDLSWLLFHQSNNKISELGEYFPDDNCFFSYQFGVAKPNLRLFQEALTFCKKLNISPQEVVYIGNDLFLDIASAASCGIRTVLFTGDREQLRTGKGKEPEQSIIPDITIEQLPELMLKLSF
jgi:putative hydrolase of the HAD superfamily